MEILIERNRIALLRQEEFRQAEGIGRGEKLRIELYKGSVKTVWLMRGTAVKIFRLTKT